MMNAKLFGNLCLFALAGAMSCTKNTLNLPEPAQSVEGMYRAEMPSKTFPIKGQTVLLSVKRVNKDTVGVTMWADLNGQRGDSITYNKALIEQQLYFGNSCISYVIYLKNAQETNRLTMTCSEVSTFIYSLNSQTYNQLARFKKI